MLTEIRIAARSLAKSPGFALAAVITLGLGVALCAAVLLVLNAYLFRTLPYPAGRALESQLFGVPALDPLTLLATTAGFALAGYLAIWWPARRAASTDPAAALKEET